MTSHLSDALFGGTRVFTLPAGADFLGDLAKTLIDVTGAREHPEQLSDALVFVPNRRSARALAARLFSELNSPGFLPPDIRPLGDAGDNDPALLGELTDVDVRPPMPKGSRLGALTLLVNQWHDARGEHITLASAMSVARDLARLLDQAALAGDVRWEELPNQVENAELAKHWEISVEFLSILTSVWPDFLEDKGFSDSNARDRMAAEALCQRWEREPPNSPVVVAGSTGSSPSTRLLMAAAMKLPKGAVLFPGLEHDVDAQTWHAISNAPSHPQFAFAETLSALQSHPDMVRLWPGYTERPALQPRRQIIQESLAPADTTADWVTRLKQRAAPASPQSLTTNGLKGLSLIEAASEAEEANAIALLMREVLETPERTAALVTPDATLARRVSALMERWDVHVSPSAGWPILQTRAGRFMIAALDWALDPGGPLALARLLKHELTVLSDNTARDASISALERGLLRDLRSWKTLSELGDKAVSQAERAEKKPKHALVSADEYDLANHLIEDLHTRAEGKIEPILEMIEDKFDLRGFTEAFAELCDTLTRHPDDEGPSLLWSGQDGSSLARFLEEIAQMGDFLPPIEQDDLRPLITQLAGDLRVVDDLPSHPRLNIWGPLEARLQSCDLMILASLNEGSWPEAPSTDGFLPRNFRANIGLPDTEARVGLAAHDFAQLACSPEVVLTRSERVDDKPAVASRWLWRLRILASGALESLEDTDALLHAPTAHILDWVAHQHDAKDAPPVTSPAPKPPADKRTDTISVTEVETLIRDPYGFYAKNLLELEPLEQIDPDLSPMSIGIAMHKALERFDTLKAPYVTVDNMVASFGDELTAVGADDLFIAEREMLWQKAANEYLDWMRSRDEIVATRNMEVNYSVDLTVKGRSVYMSGRADMVETLQDGKITITDFKTGSPPSAAQVASGLAPQLPLLAAMARISEDDAKPKGEPADLFYVGFGSKNGVTQIADRKGKRPIPELVDDAFAGLKDLLSVFADANTPYLSGPRIQFLSKYSDYDGLSRKAEWADPGHEGMEDVR